MGGQVAIGASLKSTWWALRQSFVVDSKYTWAGRMIAAWGNLFKNVLADFVR